MTESIFSFFLSKETNPTEYPFENSFEIGGYNLFTDAKTPLDYCKKDNRELIVFGYAVDVFSGQSKNLAETILANTKNIDDVIGQEKKLGGKYVIFYADKSGTYCVGDATGSIPVFYTASDCDFICCSNPKWIVDKLELKTDRYLQSIRDSGPLNQAMPFDITPYKEILQLIPNHYLDFSKQNSVRFINSAEKQKAISPEEAAIITAPMIDNIAKLYVDKFDVLCPLTSGRDSRVVYAYLKDKCPDLRTYTIWQDKFANDDQDWTVPLELIKKGKTDNHKQHYKEEIPAETKADMDALLGIDGYPEDAFVLSVTVQKHYGNSAAIEGDIIGQVGKCSLHRDIPLMFATPRYFRCKLHNYSDGARRYLKAWLDEIKNSGEKVNPFDLFSVENRLGVWATQTHLIRNTMGMPFVNIFNSRSIIYVMTAVDRAERMKSRIHIELIKLKAPELLDVPFEQEHSGIVNAAKSNKFVFYFASFAKYYIQKRKFHSDKGGF
ncbi:MAG: hypothetical protein IIW48_00335 [Clostridia bacterium]|nr:hypothetical protein [Clostridia bacterium]